LRIAPHSVLANAAPSATNQRSIEHVKARQEREPDPEPVRQFRSTAELAAYDPVAFGRLEEDWEGYPPAVPMTEAELDVASSMDHDVSLERAQTGWGDAR
jgi:hypothetical protein